MDAQSAGPDAAPKPHVYLDIDIGGWRAAYARAVAFVKATNLRYNLTSNILEELGGGEKKRIRLVLLYQHTPLIWMNCHQ